MAPTLGEPILRAAQLDGVKGQTVAQADALEWLLEFRLCDTCPQAVHTRGLCAMPDRYLTTLNWSGQQPEAAWCHCSNNMPGA